MVSSTAGLPRKIYEAVWATDFFSGPRTKQNEWNAIVAALAFLDDVERRYPGNALVLHKRINRLTDGLDVLLANPRLAAARSEPSTILTFAATCIAVVPRRFRIDSPFGAACFDAWEKGHRAFATLAPGRLPSWRRALQGFERAAKAARNAPRTHREGHLRAMDRHRALLEVGREAPWMPAALAVAKTTTLASSMPAGRPSRRTRR